MSGVIQILTYFVFLTSVVLIFRKRVIATKFLQIFYIALIRTKIGIKLMDKIAKKIKRTKILSWTSIISGFALMTYISYDILKGFYQIFAKQTTATVSLVLPFEVKGTFYVPFTYWLISVIIVIIVHEFSHGVFARMHKMRVKSSGFAVLGAIIPLIPGAFVDIDEKKLQTKTLFAQLSVFSAGPFANIITGAIFLALLLTTTQIVNSVYSPAGVIITDVAENSPAKITGLAVGEIIKNIDDKKISTIEDFTTSFEAKKIGDNIKVGDKKAQLAKNPTNNNPYLGVFVEQKIELKKEYLEYLTFANVISWLKELFFWIFAINIGVGAFNLLPLGPLDGGRMLNSVVCKILKHKHAKRFLTTVNTALLIVLLTSIIYPIM